MCTCINETQVNELTNYYENKEKDKEGESSPCDGVSINNLATN